MMVMMISFMRRKQQQHSVLLLAAIFNIICVHVFRPVVVAAEGVEFLKNVQSGESSCFCKLGGEVDDCSCTTTSVDLFNNNNIYPRLNSLLLKDYFKFYPVDLRQPCKFWSSGGQCQLKYCSVKACAESEVPSGLRNGSGADKYSAEAQEQKKCDEDDEKDVNATLGKLDTTISDANSEAFKSWTKHDDALNNFCELDDETSPTLQYIDLILNPEAFTGYSGDDAHKIWHSIYDENCFERLDTENSFNKLYEDTYLEGLCLEKRIFYRMVSGLHTSINTHLSARYFFPGKTALEKDRYGINAQEFQSRFDAKSTNGRGPQWLKNLYFTYLVELRAIAKAAPYLEKEVFYTGKKEEDDETLTAVRDLLGKIKSFKDHFDESKLFLGDAAQLKEEFRLTFLNISRIMDCVGCEKCRLWGKVQIRGMGTALKILFSGDSMGSESTVQSQPSNNGFYLNRIEIVSLFNAFGRLSTSIKYIEDFRRLVV